MALSPNIMQRAKKMERAGTVIARWRKAGRVDPDDLARAAWRVACGPTIGAHTLGVKLVRKHLIVQVEDQIWQRQLFTLRGNILAALSKVLGSGVIEDIEFRVPLARIGPGREEVPRAKPARNCLRLLG